MSSSSSCSADEKLPLGYLVSDGVLRAYATKRGLTESDHSDILWDAISDLRLKFARGSFKAHMALPLWCADYTGDGFYMQVSGWEGCERGTDWRAGEDVEKAYCKELGLKFGEGRTRFKPLGYYQSWEGEVDY